MRYHPISGPPCPHLWGGAGGTVCGHRPRRPSRALAGLAGAPHAQTWLPQLLPACPLPMAVFPCCPSP